MIIAMIMSPLRNKYSLKSARAAIAGSAPLGAGPQKRFEDLLGGAPFTQVYGMTETTCIAMLIPWPEHDYTGGAGRPVANVDVKLVNDEGQDITAYDTTGEICFRGPIVIPGYFENPEANKASFDADGFFHTGDVGYLRQQDQTVVYCRSEERTHQSSWLPSCTTRTRSSLAQSSRHC